MTKITAKNLRKYNVPLGTVKAFEKCFGKVWEVSIESALVNCQKIEFTDLVNKLFTEEDREKYFEQTERTNQKYISLKSDASHYFNNTLNNIRNEYISIIVSNDIMDYNSMGRGFIESLSLATFSENHYNELVLFKRFKEARKTARLLYENVGMAMIQMDKNEAETFVKIFLDEQYTY